MLAGFQNLTFEFGARKILEDVTWHIQPNEHIGLIGYNGTGKSTLLKLLAGEYSPSAGSVERSRNISIGYLHQDLLSFDTGDPILKVAMGAFDKVLNLEKELEQLAHEMEVEEKAGKSQSELLLLAYTDKLHEMELLDGYNIHHKTEEVLQGLGFSNADLQRPYREFSGGWRMRVLLAKMILQKPDLLLLDEPTNHLDLPSIEWLEKYLQHYQGSVVIVSHDKFFLDRMVHKIVELYQQDLHFYNGNYSFYEKEKEMRITLQQRAYENQKDYIRQQERFIERFKAKASKAAAAQSAMKRLDKMERIENVELERPDMRIQFRVDRQPGKVLVQLKDLSKSFGDIEIIRHAEAEIERGDKIALIGANGKGKSTVLRILAGTETFTGDRTWGHHVDASFYAQHQLESLNINDTVLEEMKHSGSQKNELELRTLLGCFLFSGDDVEKKIKVLSGGEKARVALAKTIAGRANFLLLDEPTNHLDIHSCELLAEALNKYEGSYILVSHDRFFISKTANKIWEIENGQIKMFKGTYDEWVEWNKRMNMQVKPGLNKPKIDKPVAEQLKPIIATQPVNKELKKRVQKQQKLVEQLDEDIIRLQSESSRLEQQLSVPEIYANRQKFLVAESEYKKAILSLSVARQNYDVALEKLMELEEQQ
ncbi:MAG TPA: ABC-F family ATP-binding cassette domain-containing protein [Puia sp.]|jgi:ATP-binding cassette subfamily F protein 3|nr:ABC-F family ATP-binding cassette domain-containing protein [Puia sp.]